MFGQTIGHDFVNFDDKTYVYGNPIVTSGLTLVGIKWAFTHSHALNWHPLTTISHMLDCQLFGLDPAGHHFTNVLLHTIAVLLLFFVLRQMTGMLWRSAFVAALFAIHPLRVESVAWIAERKDVLSAVFFMLTLGAYVRYTRNRTVGRYIVMAFLFACGLMSKPMLVTTPFVLLLLDWWPLARLQRTEIKGQRTEMKGLLLEKVPLIFMSAASCVATLIAQHGVTGQMEPLPLTWRIENALISYVVYIRQMFWPTKLAGFYPAHPFPFWEVILATVFLVASSALAIALRKTRPYIFTGWFWYLGMLVPVIGIFQVGLQSHADRYTYLPQIGLSVLLTWLVADLPKTPNTERRTSNIEQKNLTLAFDVGRSGFSVFFAAIIIALAWGAWSQAQYLEKQRNPLDAHAGCHLKQRHRP